jgi:hypothetical protein
MRRRLLWTLLLLAPVLFLSSCKEDEDPVPAIVGTWVRSEYEFSNLDITKFSQYDKTFDNFVGESGYTILFKADGTYSRSFTPYVNDEGKWTLEGSELKLSPSSGEDIDDIEDVGILGTEFDVEGDVTESRLVFSQVIKLYLYSDAYLATVPDDGSLDPTKRTELDLKVLYKFNKLK